MNATAHGHWFVGVTLAMALTGLPAGAAEPERLDLARKAHDILKTNCYRCHGQDGAIEGGMNFILDRDKLVARKKVVPGNPEQSPLFKRVAAGKMPPPSAQPRPSAADVALLKQWIETGAASAQPVTAARPLIGDAEVFARILADLETIDGRSRRFTRYFTLTHLYNAGLSEDELQTYRHALAKLTNSLSWHPRITVPRAIDSTGTILRIDLRDFQWDANLWNRILVDYPYGILQDTATAKACLVATATRLPFVRADWFVATASRPPLYQDILQLPTSLAELERQLRVDAALDIQQERVARAGFNGSGIAKNNRLLERHDAAHGAYWRTYDFEAVAQNLTERDNLLPDRRNLFAHPLGPGFTEASFQHAGGEAIWNLPNGLQAYFIVNANGQRLDKASTAIVSDPKRPDKAVETGVSCMSCHYAGINQKADQIRDFAQKNPKAFARADAELIRALYPPEARMKALMDEDCERFRKAVEKTGGTISAFEPIMMLTLRYEDDVDLPTAAAEAGLRPEEFGKRLGQSALLGRNLGALKVAGGTVQRQVWLQGFGDVVRELGLGTLLQQTLSGQTLPDNTGEIDPLEGQSSAANSVAFAPDGRFALFASADKSVRLWSVDNGRDLRRFIGHTGSVWSVAFSSDGRRALSGSADSTMRLWDVETGREIRRFEGHTGLVSCVAFAPDDRRALSGGYDQAVCLWDLETGKELRRFEGDFKTINAVAFAPDGRRALIGEASSMRLWDLETGKELGRFTGHTDSVIGVSFTADGKHALSCSDDGTLRLWDAATRRELRSFSGHAGPVKCLALSGDGHRLLSGGADHTVRLWDLDHGQELRRFAQHTEAVVCVAFTAQDKQTLSGSRDAAVRLWDLGKVTAPVVPKVSPAPGDVPEIPVQGELRPGKLIPIGAPIGNLLLSPNGKWLYYLNTTQGKLERIDATTLHRDREIELAEGTEALCLTRDGKVLYATVRSKPAAPGVKTAPEGKIQVVDPLKMELRKTIVVPADPYDVAATDAGLVFVSGGSGDWTDIVVVDAAQGKVATRWGGIWARSFIQLAPEQNRLYVSTQGVSPGTASTLVIPEKLGDKPVVYASAPDRTHPLGGEFALTPDGKYLLAKTGTVLRLAGPKADDLRYVATVSPFLALAVDAQRHAAWVLTQDGGLEEYSYPEFKLQARHRLGVVAYQMVLDSTQGRLYVAGLDPRALGDRSPRKSLGDIYVYELKELVRR